MFDNKYMKSEDFGCNSKLDEMVLPEKYILYMEVGVFHRAYVCNACHLIEQRDRVFQA